MDKSIQRWISVWTKAAARLSEIKKEELRSLDYAKCLPVLDDMIDWGLRQGKPRLTSGLVEYQRRISGIREKSTAATREDA